MNTPSVDQRFGKWTVLEYLGKLRYSKDYWKCRCDCGTERTVSGATLRDGRSTNCGCVRNEKTGNLRRSHMMSNSPEYHSWWAMRQRTTDPKNIQYADYGGRGIKVCDRWKWFENFYADMGRKPSKHHSIERIDNDGDYSPDNCRWATHFEQGRNKRTNHLLTFDNLTLSLTEWGERTGIRSLTILKRINLGWSVEKALTTPVYTKRRQL